MMAWTLNDLFKSSETSTLVSPLHVSSESNSDNRQSIGELTAVVDPNWVRESPSSSMRIAQFRLPSGSNDIEDAELAIFSGIGGSVEGNLDRWFSQFQQPDGTESKSKARVREFMVGGMNTTIADLSGTFTGSGMPMSSTIEKKGYRLLAAIVKVGGDIYYFKLLGPQSTVGQWAESYGKFIGNLKTTSM